MSFQQDSDNEDVDLERQPKATLCLFFADWCPHCLQFEEVWMRLKSSPSLRNKVQFSQVDCTTQNETNKRLAEQFNVQGYPTLVMDKAGRTPEKYSGPRTFENIATYIDNV